MKVKKIFIALALTLVMTLGIFAMTGCDLFGGNNGNGGDPFASPSAQLAGGGQDGAWLMTSGSFETATRLRGQVMNWNDSRINTEIASQTERNNNMAIVDGLNVNLRAFMVGIAPRDVVAFERTGNYYTGDLRGTTIRFTVRDSRAYAHIVDTITLSGGRGTVELDEVLVFERGIPQFDAPIISDGAVMSGIWVRFPPLGGSLVRPNTTRIIIRYRDSGEQVASMEFAVADVTVGGFLNIHELLVTLNPLGRTYYEVLAVALGIEGLSSDSAPSNPLTFYRSN